MHFTRICVGGIAGAIVLFILGYLINELIGVYASVFDGPNTKAAMRADTLLVPTALMQLCIAFVIAAVYSLWSHISTPLTGAKHGLWLGALMGLIAILLVHSVANVTSVPGIALFTVVTALSCAAAGAVIGMVYSRIPI